MAAVSAAQFPLMSIGFGLMGGDFNQVNILLLVSVVACFAYLLALWRKPVEGEDGDVPACTTSWWLLKWCYP
jgi:hypothetical protein